MKIAVVTGGFDGIQTQWSLWKLEKDLIEARRILEVRRAAVDEQERKVARMVNELRKRRGEE